MARRGFAILFTFLGIAFFISIVGFGLLYLAFGREPAVPPNATLVLRVGGELTEVAPADVVSYLRGVKTPTVRSVVDNLRKAKVDARVRAVLLKPTGFDSPFWGKVQEIRDAVIDFRKSGKPVYAYLEYGGDREYYLATAADKVFLMPSTPLDLAGVATYELFLRGTLDKIGAYPDLHRIGDYKTAVNTFKEKGYTAAHKEMDQSMNRDLYEQIVRGIADGRKKNEADVRKLIDEGPFLPEDALRAGLVDDIAYEDQVDDKLRAGQQRQHLDGDDYARVSTTSVGLNKGPRIAIIYATGTITSGKSGYDPVNGPVAGSDTLIEYIRQARHDSSVRAIVLRVDSPGGSASASDAIWRELTIAKTERADRPLIVVDVRPGRLGRLLHRDAGAGHRRAAVHAHRVDRHLRRQVRHRRRLREAGRAHRVDQHRPERGDQFTGAPLQPGGAEEAAGAAAGVLRPVRREGRGLAPQHAGENRRARAGARVDGTPGQAERAGRRARRAGSRRRRSPSSARRLPPTATSSWSCTRRGRASTSCCRNSSADRARASNRPPVGAWLNANLSKGELEALRIMRGPFAMFHRGEPLALMPFTFLR